MWGNIVTGILGICFFALMFVSIKTKGRKKTYIIIAVFLGLVSTMFSISPVENLFYSFPSALAVAEYACPGEVLGIVEGENSSLIVYEKSAGTAESMISLKTADGFKIGGGADIDVDIALVGNYAVSIIRSRRCSDQYLLIQGISADNNISIRDNYGTQYAFSSKYARVDGSDGLNFLAFASLDASKYQSYEIAVTNTVETTIISLEKLEDDIFKVKQ